MKSRGNLAPRHLEPQREAQFLDRFFHLAPVKPFRIAGQGEGIPFQAKLYSDDSGEPLQGPDDLCGSAESRCAAAALHHAFHHDDDRRGFDL